MSWATVFSTSLKLLSFKRENGRRQHRIIYLLLLSSSAITCQANTPSQSCTLNEPGLGSKHDTAFWSRALLSVGCCWPKSTQKYPGDVPRSSVGRGYGLGSAWLMGFTCKHECPPQGGSDQGRDVTQLVEC